MINRHIRLYISYSLTKLRKLDKDAPVPVICGSLLRSYRDDSQRNYLVVETTERSWPFAIFFFYIIVRDNVYCYTFRNTI
jgi:hypothetical protein